VCSDSTHGKGNILANSAALSAKVLEGEPVLRRLYDFNRQPGASALLVDALSKRFPASAAPLGLAEVHRRGAATRVGALKTEKVDPPLDVFA
jgi:hypothetical protein